MNLWLSPVILNWNRDPLYPKTSSDEDLFKPYKLLQQAKKRIDEVDDKDGANEETFALGEAVSHLRGAIEHRQKQIIEKFNLQKLSIEGWPKGKDYDKLSELGIMRPALVKKLIDLRNSVIHEQKFPRNSDKHSIDELFEFTWYFMRSSDSFLGRVISGMVLYPPDFSDAAFDEDDFEYVKYDGCFFVEISPKHKWRVDIGGYGIPINLFSKTENKDWLELAVNDFDDRDIYGELGIGMSMPTRVGDSPPPEKITNDIRDEQRRKRIDKYFSSGTKITHFEGKLIGPSEIVKSIIKEYFTLFMFY